MAKGIRKSDLKEVIREVLREEIITMGEANGQDMTEILPALLAAPAVASAGLGVAGGYLGSKVAGSGDKDDD